MNSNYQPALEAGLGVCFQFKDQRSGASDAGCSMKGEESSRRCERRILIASLLVFVLGSSIPTATVGCLHDGIVYGGLPFAWLGVEVGYGAPIRRGDSFERGPITSIRGFDLQGGMLLLELATAVGLGSATVWVIRRVGAVRGGLRGRGGSMEPGAAPNAAGPHR